MNFEQAFFDELEKIAGKRGLKEQAREMGRFYKTYAKALTGNRKAAKKLPKKWKRAS